MTDTLTAPRADSATADTLARQLLAATWTDGGATLDPGTGTAPTDGYMVGVAGRGAVLRPVDSTATAAEWIARTLPTLAAGECLGSWVDDGLVYLDVSINVADREAALTLARDTGELAIWDVAAGVEIAATA